MKRSVAFLSYALRIYVALVFSVALSAFIGAQVAKKPDTNVEASKPAETDKNAAQIELLETKYRFEVNGDSRKEVHTRVRINNELGVRQFARLSFDFNRSFQQIEIPLARVTHASGGIADILPSAITDNPNPAVVDAPAYQDVRVKSVRILGLQPGDLLEYRVITTTTHHPLAPDFWLDHTFDRSGVVSKEIFELDLPKSENLRIHINPLTPLKNLTEDGAKRVVYLWDFKAGSGTNLEKPDAEKESDIALTTFASWESLASRLSAPLATQGHREIEEKVLEFLRQRQTVAESIFYFVAERIRTVDLPLGATGFAVRTPEQILHSGYGTKEDKFVLMNALMRLTYQGFLPVLTCVSRDPEFELPRPALFDNLLVRTDQPETYYSDLAPEVIPFGAIWSNLRGKKALLVYQLLQPDAHWWVRLPEDLPFPSTQRVSITASITSDAQLKAKAKYELRGDNELLLRVAFHKTPKDKWKDVAQLLAISDGFRGEITNVNASDPYATKEPFTVEYEISQPKFVDWSKKPVRIPALLPFPGLPEPPSAGSSTSSAKKSIDLGTPLEIELDATVQLPEGSTAISPIGTSVGRDYATFSSKYSAQGNTIHATRKLHFIAKEIPATRAGDLNAFLHAVQADQTQLFTLQPAPQK